MPPVPHPVQPRGERRWPQGAVLVSWRMGRALRQEPREPWEAMPMLPEREGLAGRVVPGLQDPTSPLEVSKTRS